MGLTSLRPGRMWVTSMRSSGDGRTDNLFFETAPLNIGRSALWYTCCATLLLSCASPLIGMSKILRQSFRLRCSRWLTFSLSWVISSFCVVTSSFNLAFSLRVSSSSSSNLSNRLPCSSCVFLTSRNCSEMVSSWVRIPAIESSEDFLGGMINKKLTKVMSKSTGGGYCWLLFTCPYTYTPVHKCTHRGEREQRSSRPGGL